VVHGYTVAFALGAGMLTLAAIASAVFVTARKEDLPSDSATPAVA
jgi:hypothetical protein